MKSAVSLTYDPSPRRRWSRLIIPFLLLVGGITAWRTDPQTWRQLRLAAFGATANDEVQVDALPSSASTIPINDFAGKGEVDVDGGLLQLFPLVYGEVAEVFVRVDQRVNVGDPLLRIRNKAAELLVDEAQKAALLAQIDLDKAKRAPAELQNLIQSADLAIQAEERLVAAAQRNLDQLRNLSQQVSDESIRTGNDAVAVAKQRLEAKRLERERLNLRRPQDDIRTAETALERAKIKVAEAAEVVAQSTLRARQSAKVVRLDVRVGEVFPPTSRTPAILLCPDKPWIVRCEIEQEFAGRVHEKMSAEVFDDATGQKVGEGVVERLSSMFAPRRQPVEDSRLHNDFRTMEVTIVLTTDHERLRIGQHVRAVFHPVARTTRPAG